MNYSYIYSCQFDVELIIRAIPGPVEIGYDCTVIKAFLFVLTVGFAMGGLIGHYFLAEHYPVLPIALLGGVISAGVFAGYYSIFNRWWP